MSASSPIGQAALCFSLLVLSGCSAGSTRESHECPPNALCLGPGGAPSTSGSGGGAGFPVSGTGGDVILPGAGGDTSVLPEGGACGSQDIDTSVEEVIVPGNVLIIFDQSDSMTAADFNGKVRWVAASDAIYAAIDANKDALTVGAIFFPTNFLGTLLVCDPNQSVAAIDDTTSSNPQIPFMPGPQFLQAWVQHWARNPLTVGTPIDAGLVRGGEALSKGNLQGKTVVIFVTDGEPTCTIGSTLTDLPAQWAAQGIPTYVVGLPGAGSGTLTSLATAAGTAPFFTPADGTALEQRIADITSKIVARTLNSCAITLNQEPPNKDDIVLVVTEGATGQKFAVNPGGDGWQLEPDGMHATLQGATCNDALAGRFSKISFAFGCLDIPILR